MIAKLDEGYDLVHGWRRDILSEIELHDDMHRFIPILLYKRGTRCAEVVTNHRPRVAGVTKYGIGRTLVVLLDLVTVKFMIDHAAHPMRLFGGLARLYLTRGNRLQYALRETMKIAA